MAGMAAGPCEMICAMLCLISEALSRVNGWSGCAIEEINCLDGIAEAGSSEGTRTEGKIGLFDADTAAGRLGIEGFLLSWSPGRSTALVASRTTAEAKSSAASRAAVRAGECGCADGAWCGLSNRWPSAA